MQPLLVAISPPTWKVPSSNEMQFTQGRIRATKDREAALSRVSTKKIKRQRGGRAHVSAYAVVCMCVRKGQRGQYWHGIFWAHGAAAAAARPRVLRFLQRPPLWWPVSAHCHPDSTSVNMLKPPLSVKQQQTKRDGRFFLCSRSWKYELGLQAMA